MTIIPITIGALGIVTKVLLKGLEDLESGGFWERPEYLEESWRFEETCYHWNSSEKPSAKTNVKNSQGVNNNNYNYNNHFICLEYIPSLVIVVRKFT